jgi:hypothetical protein
MKINFQFDGKIPLGLRSKLEDTITADFKNADVSACHGDSLRVTVNKTSDPPENGIEIAAHCACGKLLKSAVGSDDAARMQWR